MARQNLRNVVQAASIENTVLGEVLDDGALFRKFPGDQTPPIFPTRQLIPDNMVGSGAASPRQGKPQSFDPRNIPYNGALNTTMGVRLFRLFLGGTVTPTVRNAQVETAVIVGTITLAGNVEVVVTAAGLTGSPITLQVAVLLGDSASVVAGKIRTALAANSVINAFFIVSGAGANVVLTKRTVEATDATLNIAYADGTTTGLTPDATSNNSTDLEASTDFAITQKEAGSEPLFFNLLRELGGESLLHADAFVQTYEVTQSGRGEPRLSATIMNSGHFAKIADTNIDTADIEDLDEYKKFDGNETRLTFSDGTTSYDFINERRQLDVSFRGSQNVIVENLPGEPVIDVTNHCLGSYSDVVYIDVQTGEITVKVYMDEDFTEFDAWLENKKLTSVTLIFKTCETIGAGDRAELEIKFPIAEFNITPDTQGNFSAYTLTMRAIESDPVTGSWILGRVRQVEDLDEVIA